MNEETKELLGKVRNLFEDYACEDIELDNLQKGLIDLIYNFT